MGQPVIAGDPVVADRYRAWLGEVPYTYANDEETLTAALRALVLNPAWRAEEAARVGAYVRSYHDYAAVALRYLDLLDDALHWRARQAVIQSPLPERIDAPVAPIPEVSISAPITTHEPEPIQT